jgi:hypothetical protein
MKDTSLTRSTASGGHASSLEWRHSGGLAVNVPVGSRSTTTCCLLLSMVEARLFSSYWSVFTYVIMFANTDGHWKQSFAVFGASGDAVAFPTWCVPRLHVNDVWSYRSQVGQFCYAVRRSLQSSELMAQRSSSRGFAGIHVVPMLVISDAALKFRILSMNLYEILYRHVGQE